MSGKNGTSLPQALNRKNASRSVPGSPVLHHSRQRFPPQHLQIPRSMHHQIPRSSPNSPTAMDDRHRPLQMPRSAPNSPGAAMHHDMNFPENALNNISTESRRSSLQFPTVPNSPPPSNNFRSRSESSPPYLSSSHRRVSASHNFLLRPIATMPTLVSDKDKDHIHFSSSPLPTRKIPGVNRNPDECLDYHSRPTTASSRRNSLPVGNKAISQHHENNRARRPSYMRDTFTSGKKRFHGLYYGKDGLNDSSSEESDQDVSEFRAPQVLPPIWMTNAGKTPVRPHSHRKVIPNITITPGM